MATTYVFVNQTSLRITLTTNVDFTTRVPTTVKVKYIKPDTEDETEGEWVGAVLSGSESEGKIYVDFSDTVYFDETGVWRLWAYVVFNDGRIAEGRTVEQLVRSSGQIHRN